MTGNSQLWRASSSNTVKRFRRGHCNFSTNHPGSLKTRIRPKKPHLCMCCLQRFVQKCSLYGHMKRKHKNDLSFPFHCENCFSRFKQGIVKEAHEYKCRVREHKCGLCEKYTTFKKSYLKYHQLTHMYNKPHQCNMCEKSYTRKYTLNKHFNEKHGRKSS